MQVLKKARRTVRNINRSSELLESIQMGVVNQSELINRKLSEMIGILKSGPDSDHGDAGGQPLSAATSKSFSRFVKPLAKIAEYPDKPLGITSESIWKWIQSGAIAPVRSFFQDYPSNSLVGGVARELLYHIIRSIKPEHVLEVGTYYAGTSEVMARALWENGKGTLHTTDPFGASRCPAIIAQWPSPLQKHICYYPLNSMDFFLKLGERNIRPELVFIDGNHDYEFAYFDLVSAARLIQPGGIIVMDNVEQCGPFWALVEFVRQNPEWVEIGTSLADFRDDNPLDVSRSSVPHTPFILLRAPTDYVIKPAPLASGQVRYAWSRCAGIEMKMTSPAPKGTIHAQIILRCFAEGHDVEQIISTTKAPLDGQTSLRLALPQPQATSLPRQTDQFYHTLETVLFWQPAVPGQLLRLKTQPKPFA